MNEQYNRYTAETLVLEAEQWLYDLVHFAHPQIREIWVTGDFDAEL